MVTATDLANQAHIDITDEELQTLENLLKTATELVKSSINYSATDEELTKYPLFDSCVGALATALYYDRELSNGMPRAVNIMLVHLQARLGGL